MSTTQSDALELRPNGGLQVKNSRGELVFWFKGKDPEGMRGFALCYLAPEKADTTEKRDVVRQTFGVMCEWARKEGMPIFDAADLECQMHTFLREVGAPTGAERTEDITLRVLEMTTGRRVKLTLSVKSAGKNEWNVSPPKWFD
jgi:hypothetical protein